MLQQESASDKAKMDSEVRVHVGKHSHLGGGVSLAYFGQQIPGHLATLLKIELTLKLHVNLILNTLSICILCLFKVLETYY